MMNIHALIRETAREMGVSPSEVRKQLKQIIREEYEEHSPEFVELFGDREPAIQTYLEKTWEFKKKELELDADDPDLDAND